MERSDVVGLILNCEKMIEVFIKEIDEDVNKSNYLSFMGTPSLKIWDITQDIDKIAKYILDGKEDFERFKTELFNIRTRTKELQSKTIQKYKPFAHHCDMIINIIDNMERFAPNSPESDIIPSDIMRLFKNDKGKIIKFRENAKCMDLKDIAYYLDIDRELDKYDGWHTPAFDYFVWPKLNAKPREYDKYKKQFDRGIQR